MPEKLAEKDEHNAGHAGRILPLIADRVDLIDREAEILPGFSAIPAPGHTAGQIAVRVQSGEAKVLYAADALHQPVQVAYPTWRLGIDADPVASRVTRHAILQRAADENMLLMATHFPHPAAGRVVQTDERFSWQPVN